MRDHARSTGQALVERALHHAQARRRYPGRQADRGLHRQRSVRVQARRVETGQPGRVLEEREVRAAQRTAFGHGRRQARVRRPRRVAHHSRCADAGERADQRRDRHHRAAGVRELSAVAEGRRRRDRQPERAGLPVHGAVQPSASAVQQPEDPPGRDRRNEPGAVPARSGGAEGVLQGLRVDVHLQYALRQRGGQRRAVEVEHEEGARAAQGLGLRRHAGRDHEADRSGLDHEAARCRRATAAPGRLQGRSAIDGLEHAGFAARQA